MTRDDLRQFAARDWSAIADHKTADWIARKRRMSPADVLRLADELRRHALAVRPDWPSQLDREADHATHRRVAEALRAVAVIGAR